MNKNQMWATLATITAFFSLINMILVLQLEDTFYVFTAVVLAGTIISGTTSALEIVYFKRYEELIDAFVRMAKWTIAFAVVFQLQIAVIVDMNNKPTESAVLALSFIYLIVAAAGLCTLLFWSKICDAEEL